MARTTAPAKTHPTADAGKPDGQGARTGRQTAADLAFLARAMKASARAPLHVTTGLVYSVCAAPQDVPHVRRELGRRTGPWIPLLAVRPGCGRTPVSRWSAGTARWSTARASPTAPDAVQVSDRFHLWQGLSKRIGDIAATHRGCLPTAVPEPEPAPPPANPVAPSDQADTPARRHAKQMFDAVHTVTDTGRSLNAAARELGLNRRTLRKYARAATWQECVRTTRSRRPTSLDPYLDYVPQRWEKGEHTATVLHQELVAKGYRGHYQRIEMAVAPLRRGLPINTPRERPPSPREVARWITTAPSRRGLHAAEGLRRLFEHCPELDRTHDLVRQFAAMLDARDAASRWRTGSSNSRPPASLPWPAWPKPSARTSPQSCRTSPPRSTPAPTKAASPI
ncbi:hypothetical protein ACFU5O_20405 [Streptomyces sp. NPDC057445]|uniref:hypothetical protein n=1 Tax=Streptomyces sp. NPDC057445 TaxID=3346136 RepID=UPI0036749078